MKQSTGELGPKQLAYCNEAWPIFASSAEQARKAQEHADNERKRIEKANKKAGVA